jgi:hypothetical protein
LIWQEKKNKLKKLIFIKPLIKGEYNGKSKENKKGRKKDQEGCKEGKKSTLQKV